MEFSGIYGVRVPFQNNTPFVENYRPNQVRPHFENAQEYMNYLLNQPQVEPQNTPRRVFTKNKKVKIYDVAKEKIVNNNSPKLNRDNRFNTPPLRRTQYNYK